MLLLGGINALPASATPPSPYTVIASGLNNPRHLSFSSNGALFVAESGTGGSGPCIISSEGGQVCYGPTGSITEITRSKSTWKQRRVVTGLPSLAAPADDAATGTTKGGSATGPSGVVVSKDQKYVVSVGLGAAPTARKRGQATASPTSTKAATLPAGFATLIEGSLRSQGKCHVQDGYRHGRNGHHTWRIIADIAAHEQATNPVDGPDSNPASVVRSGSRYLVADAGGNTVLSVNSRGKVTTLAAFQDTQVQAPGAPAGVLMPMQFVPTAVIPGPHNSYFVSQLTGFPFPAGGATIWRVVPGHAPTAYATGLTNVTDLAFASDGSLYAVEISTAGLASGGPPIGALVRIPRGGGAAQVVVGGLFAPYGVALRGNNAYVTTGSVLPGGGQVIQVPLGH